MQDRKIEAMKLLRRASDLLSNEAADTGRTELLRAPQVSQQLSNALEFGGAYKIAGHAAEFDKINAH